MTLKTLSTRRLIQLGCAASAAASLAVGATGWWATTQVQRIDHEVLELNRVERELLGTLRDANELLLTSGSKSSREALQASLQTLRQTTQQPPAMLVGTPQVQQLAELGAPLAAFAALAKPSVENDDALVAYGKLSARAGEALGQLRAHAAQQALAAAAASRRVTLGAGVFALLAVALALACGRVMRLRLEHRLGGELETAQQLMQRVGAGDLRAIETAAPPRSVIGALAEMVRQLQTTIGAVHAGATQIQLASGEIAAGSSDLSQRTEGAAGSLQQTVSAIAQLSATVAHSAESAGQARELARGAAEVAARGGSLVGQVVATMDEINGSSKRIAEITGVIDGIAFQTNILALNAAVEAARAGEQGRGFAVVASEVRSLAQRSAEAARQIKGLIGSSVDRVEAGTRLVGDAGRTMNEINSSVQRVADIIGEISAATAEQSSGIGQVSSAVVQLEHATQQNAALAEQSTAAAAGLSDQARSLSQAVGVFALPAATA